MSKVRAWKYHNPDKRCGYPTRPNEPDPIDYCWSYALWVDGGKKNKANFVKEHCATCDLFSQMKKNLGGAE